MTATSNCCGCSTPALTRLNTTTSRTSLIRSDRPRFNGIGQPKYCSSRGHATFTLPVNRSRLAYYTPYVRDGDDGSVAVLLACLMSADTKAVARVDTPGDRRWGAVPARGRRPSEGWSAGQLVTTPLGDATFGGAPSFLM